MILQKLFESDSIIVFGIVRAVDERNSSVAGAWRIGCQLSVLAVSSSK
jgi:hypothetical protein